MSPPPPNPGGSLPEAVRGGWGPQAPRSPPRRNVGVRMDLRVKVLRFGVVFSSAISRIICFKTGGEFVFKRGAVS